jgi:hypothetical protein
MRVGLEGVWTKQVSIGEDVRIIGSGMSGNIFSINMKKNDKY